MVVVRDNLDFAAAKQLSATVVEKTKQDIAGANLYYDGPNPAQRHFDSLKRILDRTEADYKKLMSSATFSRVPKTQP